jgi:hypothetical protein
MSETKHPWCRDVSRDEAIRAAEDDAANWRRLEVGEVVQEGDEYLNSNGGWYAVLAPHVGRRVTVEKGNYRRRRVQLPDHRDLPAAVAELRERVGALEAAANPRPDPGTGWRLLADDEVIEEGDEWIVPPCYLNVWKTTCYGGVGTTPRMAGGTYRRRVVADASKMVTTKPAPVPAADGLRTERVTLEVTQRAESYAPCRDLDWQRMLRQTPGGLFPGESVRVVPQPETDAEGERLRGQLASMTDQSNARWRCMNNLLCQVTEARNERDAAIRERDAAKGECERLKARVAELEAATAANAGGEQQEPVAWGFPAEDGSLAHVSTTQPFPSTSIVVPLYTAPVAESATTPQPPRGWLTKNERAAVESARDYFASPEHDDDECAFLAAALRSLLARETPPKVRRPEYQSESRARDSQWIAAIREAGGEVEE